MLSFRGFLSEAKKASKPRIMRVRARIRNGKVQRNVKVSTVKGMTLRGGKLVRMSTQEKLHRKMGARRGKVKRRAKLARALMKRRRSIARRHSMGLK